MRASTPVGPFSSAPPTSRIPPRTLVDRWWARPQHPLGAQVSGWWARDAALILAMTSLLLYWGPLMWLLLDNSLAFLVSIPATAIHLFGWVVLGEDIHAIPARGAGARVNRKNAMWVAYAVLWMAFGIAIIALPVTLSGILEEVPLPDPWGYLLMGPFAYMPGVFAPVALASAGIFGLGSRFLPDTRRLANLAGVIILVLVSGLGLGLQVLRLFPWWAYFLAGGLGFGYLAIAMSWSVQPPERSLVANA